MDHKNKGWVSLHRALQDHWVWMDKPFSKGQAWVDLVMSANHKDNKVLLGNELIDVNRGQFITSEIKLMEKWGWSKTKVRSFLKLLQSDSMIVKMSDKKKTTITIVNYGVWQDTETTKEPQKNHEETMEELQKDTNNNDNNDNNENNINNNRHNKSSDKSSKIKYEEDSFEILAVNYLASQILKLNPNARVPDTLQEKQKWAVHIDRMKRLDKRSEHDIKIMLKYATEHPFWQSNILCTEKFRKQFDRLVIEKNKKKPQHNDKFGAFIDDMKDW